MAHEEQDIIDGWRTYGKWLDNIRDNSVVIKDYDNSSDFKERLLSCKTNQERFRLIWFDEKLKIEMKNAYIEDFKYCTQKTKSRVEKSIEESKRHRELGNKSFKEGKYQDALDQYTQAIKLAPSAETSYAENAKVFQEKDPDELYKVKDDTLALALANRSAALFAMRRFRLSMVDIDLAVKFGYPRENLFKLQIRKLKCLHVLSVWANDNEQIKKNLIEILHNPNTKDFVKAEINAMFEFLDITKPESIEVDELDVIDEIALKLTSGAKRIPNCADCLEMSYNEEKGRFLIVNKDCSIGRLMIAEEPYVCNLAVTKRNDYCYHCFNRLHSCGISCPNCIQIAYCSEACLKNSQPIHKYECNKLLDLQERLGVAYLVAHIIFKLNFDADCKFPMCTRKTTEYKSIKDILGIDPMDWPDYVYKNDYAAILGLDDHAKDYDYNDMMGHALTATYLSIAFIDLLERIDPNLCDRVLKSEEKQVNLGSLTLRHLLQLQTNLISILDQNLQNIVTIGHEISGIEEHPIGVGIYPTVALMNHSCKPNIMSLFHRNRFIGRACKSLPCGTEVKFCYGPNVSRMTKKDRKQRLLEQYFFNCSCECCSSNDENESRALVCSKCQGPVIYNSDFTHGCTKCLSTNFMEVEAHLKQLDDFHNEIERLKVSDSDPAEKIKRLTTVEETMKKIAFWKHPDFIAIKSCLSDYAQQMDDVEAGLKYSEQELELSDKTYGVDSYISIMTKLKIINLKWQNLYNVIEMNSDISPKREQGIEDLKALVKSITQTRTKLRDLLSATNIKGADSSFETEIGFLNTVQRNILKYMKSISEESKASEPEASVSTLE